MRYARLVGPHAIHSGDDGGDQPPGGRQGGDAQVKGSAAAARAAPAAGEALQDGRVGAGRREAFMPARKGMTCAAAEE